MTYYLGNDRNLLRTAILAASSFLASQSVYRTDTAAKSGGGSVSLTGSYTGAADATFDVEIVDNAGTAPVVSNPVFTGVGNAVMSGLSADVGVAAQTVVVTLEELGEITRQAYAPFQGVTLEAKEGEEDGNGITIAVDPSGLTSTATSFAVRTAMTAGTSEFSGDEWNFGAATLNVDGTIPATAPRIRFGDDPQVYRAWRKYVSGAYVYGFSPTLVRDVAAGTRVYTVSGSRTVTIMMDGVVVDTLTSVTTLYDFLRKVRDESTLLSVDGVIVNDLKPGGQGSTDLSVWTRPYVARTVRDGTQYVKDAAITVAVDEDAATEALELRCSDISQPGREAWDVIGPVSGTRSQLITGEEYVDGPYTITITRPDIARNTANASIQVEYARPNWAGEAEDPLPHITIEKPTLGLAARNGIVTFRYSRRPAPACDELGTMVGGPNPECLGVIPEGETAVSEESRKRRLQRLADVVSDHVRVNTAQPAANAGSSVNQDIAFINRAAKILSDGLGTIMTGTLQLTQWAASTVYAVDNMREPLVRDGYRHAVTVAGTSGGSAPSWNATVGGTTTDGTVTWVNIGKVPLGMWDDALALLEADALELRGRNVSTVSHATSTAFALGAKIAITYNEVETVFECTTAGTTGGTAPTTWATTVGGTTADGTVVWTRRSGDSSSAEPIDDSYYERYTTTINAAIAAAGLSPNFEDASIGSSDGCWRDDEDSEYYWEAVGYAPAVTGIYYHSSRHRYDERGNRITESTREFAFGIRAGCPELLAEGDLVTVTINGVAGVATYQVGDRITLDITRAVPVEFGGGQTGTDEYRFSVVGSVFGQADPYVLDRLSPAAYSDEGIEFLITPGGIDLALGDRWEFAIEAGRFRWRKNGGIWSSNTNIAASVSLIDGLSAVFAPGTAPSWVAADRWSFAAEAVAGPEQLRQPIGGALEWASSISLTITTDGSDIGGVLIAGHTIPSDATITLQGSDDNFASTPLNAALTWREWSIWYPTASSYAKYRLIINRGGGIFWLWIGDPLEMRISASTSELGMLTKRHRLPRLSRRAAMGCTVEHEGLMQDSVDDLLDMLRHACTYDDGRIGIVPNGETGSDVVSYVEDSIDVSDVFGHQPDDPSDRLLAVSMTLVPIP